MAPPRFGTFSIVAHDRATGSWGVAVQSKFIAVGSVVPWAEVGVGAIATQAAANVAYGPVGLRLLRAGASAADVVRELAEADAGRDERQLGVVDARGGAAAFTGKKCMDWAGHEVGNGFTCQGNILFGPAVVRGMARAYETTPGDIADRLLAALAAGQREGGDRRGMQAAALFIVRKGAGYGEGDRWVDLRVDDHATPIEELKRVFKLYDLTMLSREDPATLVPIEGEIAKTLQHDLAVLGYYSGHFTGNLGRGEPRGVRPVPGRAQFREQAARGCKGVAVDRDVPARAGDRRDDAAHPDGADRPRGADRGPGAQPKGGGSSPHAHPPTKKRSKSK